MLTPSTTTRPFFGEDFQHLARLAGVFPAQDVDGVVLFHMHLLFAIYDASMRLRRLKTSGAREIIRMNSFSRSSRATGPKIRVPRGFFCSLMMTAAFSSKRMYEPSGRLVRFCPHDHGLYDVALFDDAAGRRLFHAKPR